MFEQIKKGERRAKVRRSPEGESVCLFALLPPYEIKSTRVLSKRKIGSIFPGYIIVFSKLGGSVAAARRAAAGAAV